MLEFIEQNAELLAYVNSENIQTIAHHSTPRVKLQYPEPFIASPSVIHQDLWFMHILVYQYWLWFIFIFIIVFFFLTFLCTVRWCNNRNKPRRETRGVSRSKCGDLITACVPVTWAISIIVSESTDAIDYYDGFGTTEIIVGIRAYQWGWEYYYPKDIDLNYNLKKNYSTFVGNSLKYQKSSSVTSSTNNLWKFYKNKNFDQIVTPSHILLVPSDNKKIINLLNFNDIGASKINESNAFKKIRILSKTNNSYLYNSADVYNKKFTKFFNLNFLNTTTDTFSFSTKKQFTFVNSLSFLNNTSFILDYNSLNKFINYNLKKNNYLNNQNNNHDFFFFNKLFTNKLINNKVYFEDLNLVNNNSDKKQINFSFIKTFNKSFLKKIKEKNNLYQFFNNYNFESDIFLSSNNKDFFFNFNNYYFDNKKLTLNSNNQSLGFNDKKIRSLLNNKHFSRLNNLNFNNIQSEFNKVNMTFGEDDYYFYKLNLLNWLDVDTNYKLSKTRLNLDTPYSPISTNNVLIKNKNFDNTLKNLIFLGKEESTSPLITSIYWNFYFNAINNNWRIKNSTNLNSIKDNHYLPQFSLYYDYDFRNWQAMELLEDAFWETSFSIYLQDEYRSLIDHLNCESDLEKNLISFLAINSSLTPVLNLNKKNDFNYDSLFLKKNDFDESDNMNYMYQEDGFTDPFFFLKKNYNFLSLIYNHTNNEETYENFKNYFFFFNNYNNNIFLFSNNFFNINNYSTILNSFRSDFDEFSFFIEKNNFFKIFNNYELNQFDNVNVKNSNSRVTEFINLRSTAKNSIVTFNAMQKVFKTRLDEYRSHSNIEDFSNSFSKQPFIDSNRVSYESILKKNDNFFFDSISYKSILKKNDNFFFNFDSISNFYTFEFPFLISLKSDSSRYIWFDWFSKWGFFEVQPSSSSKYAIFGMPYFNKNFEFSSTNNEQLNETENYFIRIARSRKNYMTNWVYSPFMQIKNNNFNKNTNYFSVNNKYLTTNSLLKIKNTLNNNNFYWTKLYLSNTTISKFNYSNSGLNTYTRATWQPNTSIQSYYYHNSVLIDLLSKREYCYRIFFLKKNNIINLPIFLTNSPKNPLLNELKSSFMYIDNIIHRTEYSRDIYYYSLNHFNYLTISSYLSYLNLNNILNYSNFLNKIALYFNNTFFFQNSNEINKNYELLKNQYRPMKKGISNMVRLHATGAIALPIETRIQILASSKDVIHSWAIPSAGIKIDCVPGYSSHRVIIFLVSGIFWGQCMEICGRYHHWMPIVVFFMKKDLFFLWCTHFIFLNNSNYSLSMNDRQYLNFSKQASYDKNNWLN